MKKALIEKLYEIFEEDKDVMKENLLKATDEVSLTVSNDYQSVKLNIKIERK